MTETRGRMAPAHAFEEHTGEVRLRVEAPTLGELFAEAGRALAALMTGGQAGPVGSRRARLEVEAPDRDALMVDWLNELVYRAEVDRTAYGDIDVEVCDGRRVVAEVAGPEDVELVLPVKAATFHGLEIVEEPRGFRAWVVLDV